jgi:hypothetical protein
MKMMMKRKTPAEAPPGHSAVEFSRGRLYPFWQARTRFP